MAKQTSKFPSDPRTLMVALIAISGIPWAMGREQLFAFSDDSFMLSFGLMHCAGEKSGLRSFFVQHLAYVNRKKNWKESIHKFVYGPLWYVRSILTQKNLYLALRRKPEITCWNSLTMITTTRYVRVTVITGNISLLAIYLSVINANTYCMLLVYLGNPDYGQYEDVD